MIFCIPDFFRFFVDFLILIRKRKNLWVLKQCAMNKEATNMFNIKSQQKRILALCEVQEVNRRTMHLRTEFSARPRAFKCPRCKKLLVDGKTCELCRYNRGEAHDSQSQPNPTQPDNCEGACVVNMDVE